MDIDTYFRFSLALVFVIALFFVVALLLRRFGLGGAAATPRRQRRVSIVEVTPLDARRRLVLVRRDEVEHLLLLGTGGDFVVEAGIRHGFRDAVATVQAQGQPQAQPQSQPQPLFPPHTPAKGDGQ